MGPQRSDAELVEEARRGSRAAFDELIDRYWNSAASLARQHCRSWADAEDAVQEAFVRAHGKLAQLRDARRFGGWLFSIVVRQAIEETRRRRPLPVEDVEVAKPRAAETAVHDADRRDLRDQIQGAIGALPERYRAVVVLRYGQGLSVKDIGQTLGLPVGTVVSQLFRANRILRTRLKHLVGTS